MISDFSLYHFRFHLESKAPLHMPAYNKGNVIRGGFEVRFACLPPACQSAGRCRHRQSGLCVTGIDNRRKAIGDSKMRYFPDSKGVSLYGVFHPFVPEGSEKISKNRDIPRRFVIQSPLKMKENYSPGERLSYDLVFVGKTKENRHVPVLREDVRRFHGANA